MPLVAGGVLLVALATLLVLSDRAAAAVSVSPPGNGTGLSLDTTSYSEVGGPAGTGAYRTLSGLIIRELTQTTDFDGECKLDLRTAGGR